MVPEITAAIDERASDIVAAIRSGPVKERKYPECEFQLYSSALFPYTDPFFVVSVKSKDGQLLFTAGIARPHGTTVGRTRTAKGAVEYGNRFTRLAGSSTQTVEGDPEETEGESASKINFPPFPKISVEQVQSVSLKKAIQVSYYDLQFPY